MRAEITIDTPTLLSLKHEMQSEDFPISFSILSGNGYSGVKGNGNDLYGIREYQPGDNLKRINRQATARTGELHLNEYLEERMLSAYVVLDQSSSLFFTSTDRMKSVLAARKACSVLFHYQQKGHRIGGEVFNNQNHADFPATTSLSLYEEWIETVSLFNHSLLSSNPSRHKHALPDALNRCLNRNLNDRELYIVTDLLSYDATDCIRLLSTLGKTNRIYLIQVSDPLEDCPPLRVWLSGNRGDFVLRSESERKLYFEKRNEKKRMWTDFARSQGFSYTECFT